MLLELEKGVRPLSSSVTTAVQTVLRRRRTGGLRVGSRGVSQCWGKSAETMVAWVCFPPFSDRITNGLLNVNVNVSAAEGGEN